MFFVRVKMMGVDGYLAPGAEPPTFTLVPKEQAELFVTREEAETALKELGVAGEVEN
jgi:hypothetical protein